jgi:O-acetyl-ADP-ribose deacetylase (regulator of RNase III)
LKIAKNNIIVYIELGDITEFMGDAIVNPANTLMIMGGGVAGAIKKRGGLIIEEEAKKHAPIPIGQAIATTAGKLRVKYVIHAPTVQYPASPSTREYVYQATKAALLKARELGVETIAFPLMGAGVGGLSPEESIEEMLKAIMEFSDSLEVHVFVRSRDLLDNVLKHIERNGWIVID